VEYKLTHIYVCRVMLPCMNLSVLTNVYLCSEQLHVLLKQYLLLSWCYWWMW